MFAPRTFQIPAWKPSRPRPRMRAEEDPTMPIKTGKQYIDSLRDGRRLYIDGKVVTDVTDYPPLQGVIGTIAGPARRPARSGPARPPGLHVADDGRAGEHDLSRSAHARGVRTHSPAASTCAPSAPSA